MANEFIVRKGIVSLGDIQVSGSISATGTVTISGSIASSSYASNSERLDNLDSTSFVFTSSYNPASSSFSTRVSNIEGNYATTGSNIFTGAQTVCANITSTGTIIAQTLNVQQVTSSVVYSSGSNVFGNDVSNTQVFTGSMLVTGSMRVIGNACATGTGCFGVVCSPTIIGGTNINTGTSCIVDSHMLNVNGDQASVNVGLTLRNTNATYPKVFGLTNVNNNLNLYDYTANSQRLRVDTNGITCFACQVCAAGLYTTGNSCLAGKVSVNSIIDPEVMVRVGVIGNTTDTITCSTALRLFTSNNTAGQGVSIAFTAGSTKETGIILAAENTSGQNGDFVIRTYAGGANYPERLRITSGGCVGIGTPSPGAQLDVCQLGGDKTKACDALYLRAGGNADSFCHNQILFGYNGTTSYAHAIKTRHQSNYACDNAIDFFTWKYGDAASTKAGQYVMTIAGNGNVGIGTCYPSGYGTTLQIASNSSNDTSFVLGDGSGTSTNRYMAARPGSSGNFIFGTDGGDISFRTGLNPGTSTGTSRMTITSGGNVGIGTSSPNFTAANRTTLDINGTNESLLVFSNGGTVRAYIYNTATDQIYRTEGSRNMQFNIGGNGFMGFVINNTERMRIASTGVACFACQVCAPSGVKFGNGSSTLNYYEEGSWTPALQNATVSYTYRSGTYVRIGNWVFVRWGFLLNSISGQSGTVTISGLPFTAVSFGSYQEPNVSVSTGVLSTADFAQRARVYKGNSDTSLYGRIANNSDTAWTTSELQNGSWIIGEIFYNV